MAHAHVTLFSVDRYRKLTLIEGSFIWDLDTDIGSGDESGSGNQSKSEEFIGQNVYDVFRATNPGKYCADKSFTGAEWFSME